MLRSFILLLAMLVATPASAEWWEARTDHFIVYSQTSASDAKKFASELERFDGALRSLQNIQLKPALSDAHRLTVYRSGDTDDIGRLAGSSGVAGFYIPRMGGSVSFTPAKADRMDTGALIGNRRDSRTNLDPKAVLFHEYTHHFMYQHFAAAYPAWYREGFAETAATVVLKDDGSFHLGNPPLYRGDALFNWINIPVERMLTSKGKPTGEDYYSYYTVGWLLNHYLTFEPSRRGQLKNYLRMINAGTDPADAARKAFGDLGKLDRQIHAYKSGKLPGIEVRPANYKPPLVTMRKLSADEEAIMKVRMRSKVGVDRKRALVVARDARSVASKYPQSFAVQLGLAEAELDLSEYEPGNLPQAEAAIDRALALNPANPEALIYKGRVYLERGRQDKSQYAKARSWYAKALEADPHHPAPFYYNYLSYHDAGGAIPESAIIGLERAYDMAPYDRELRVVLTRQLLAEKKGPLARSVLMPLAIAAHESKSAKKLRDVYDLIEANKLDEAYTKLAAEVAEQDRKRRKGEDED